MANHYPLIAGDPPLGYRNAELRRRKAALWTAYESVGSDGHKHMTDISVLNTSIPAPETDPISAQRILEAVRKLASGEAANVGLSDAVEIANAMGWPPRELSVPERTTSAADATHSFAAWAARYEADSRVCESWARDVTECTERQSIVGSILAAQGAPELWWDDKCFDPSGPYRPAIDPRDLGRLAFEGPTLEDFLKLGGWAEGLRSARPTFRLAVDPCRPPFEALRFACQAVGAQAEDIGGAEPGLALVAGGGPAAAEFVARSFPGHRVQLSRGPLEPRIDRVSKRVPQPTDPEELELWWPWKILDRQNVRVGRVIVNLPPGRALQYVRRMANDDLPVLRPREHEALRRGPVANPFSRAEDIIEAAVRVLLPGGTLVLLGGVEFGEHHYGNGLLEEHGLEPAPVGGRGVDTVRRPLWFTYEPGAWGEGQGPWAPWGCLWPSSRLASVWRMPS
jgi:hypothetical protein